MLEHLLDVRGVQGSNPGASIRFSCILFALCTTVSIYNVYKEITITLYNVKIFRQFKLKKRQTINKKINYK